MRLSTRLRQMLDEPDIIVLPGAYDALSARLAERAGFNACFTTGFGFAATVLGMPDFGLLTMSETLDRVRHVVRTINVPLVADMDTGYGNALNTVRTVRECVSLGVAGIILEDQEWPKKCGHFEGKRVIPAEEHAAKLRAAADARGDDDLVIIGRTDARAPLGLEEAIRRGRLYRDSGADVVFIEAPQSIDELKQVAAAIPDTPLFANMIEGGKTPLLNSIELQELGYKMVVFPLSALFSAAKAVEDTYRTLFAEKSTATRQDAMVGFEQFEEMIGVPDWRELEATYSTE
ncbi:MAG: oxaloacetate decarboxylase [Chloroflexi bacterium]|nr:oxaloacetate decarboxylase [Chloroflexota bacterium]MCI0889502.1 oxaloacetate decarboxylase [Chloroflexota bacterium]